MDIVIVDDDSALLRSLEIVLRGIGHRVSGFRDPREALAYLEGGEQEVDVLLLDYVMGSMKGDELLQRIDTGRRRCWRTILMTGHKEEIASAKMLDALGVRLVLSKPLDLDELCAQLG